MRRKILRVLRKADSTFDELQSSTGLEGNSLRWHLNLLESGCCIEKNTKEGRTIYSLTQEGKVVDYIE